MGKRGKKVKGTSKERKILSLLSQGYGAGYISRHVQVSDSEVRKIRADRAKQPEQRGGSHEAQGIQRGDRLAQPDRGGGGEALNAKEVTDPLKAKLREQHQRWLAEVGTALVNSLKALDGSSKPHKFSAELEHEGGKPIWRPRVEGLPYLEAHLESCPLLLQALRQIRWLAGDFINGDVVRVEGLIKQLDGYDDLLLEESQWHRGLRPSFLIMVSKLAEKEAKERERTHRHTTQAIEMEMGQGLKRLMVGETTIALSECQADLWEWARLFHSLVDCAAESAGPLLRLRQRLHDEVKAFSEQMEPMRIAGFFEGICPACLPLLQ